MIEDVRGKPFIIIQEEIHIALLHHSALIVPGGDQIILGNDLVNQGFVLHSEGIPCNGIG